MIYCAKLQFNTTYKRDYPKTEIFLAALITFFVLIFLLKSSTNFNDILLLEAHIPEQISNTYNFLFLYSTVDCPLESIGDP